MGGLFGRNLIPYPAFYLYAFEVRYGHFVAKQNYGNGARCIDGALRLAHRFHINYRVGFYE